MSKFYQLEPDEWLEACKILKPAELKVLYRLRTLDPFGDRPIKFKVVDIAKDLDLNKGTVSRAIQVLGDKGYINLEIVEAIATLTTKSNRLPVDNLPSPKKLSVHNQVVCTQLERSLHNLDDRHTTSVIATQPDDLQTYTGQGSDFSHTIKTINTLQTQRIEDEKVIEQPPDEPIEIEQPAPKLSEVDRSEKSAPTEAELTKFVRHQIESKGIEMRNPELYVKTAIARDRADWLRQWHEHQKASRPVEVYRPQPWTPPDPEAGLRAIADAKAMIEARRLARG